jgi:hypothetical protein
VLNRADSVQSVASILDGGARPAWLGAPILATGHGSSINLAVFPVCTQAGDARCGAVTP